MALPATGMFYHAFTHCMKIFDVYIYVYIPTLFDICCVFDWMCDAFKDAYVVAIFDDCVSSRVFGAVKMALALS